MSRVHELYKPYLSNMSDIDLYDKIQMRRRHLEESFGWLKHFSKDRGRIERIVELSTEIAMYGNELLRRYPDVDVDKIEAYILLKRGKI